jgi:hypothetical protein
LGSDNRPRTQVDWTASAGSPPKRIEFIIDTGATRSSIVLSDAVGMRLVGTIGVQGVSAGLTQSLIFGGGQIEFDIEDRTTGASVALKHTGDVLVTSHHLIGQEVFSTHSLGLNMDYSTAPPSIRLVR